MAPTETSVNKKLDTVRSRFTWPDPMVGIAVLVRLRTGLCVQRYSGNVLLFCSALVRAARLRSRATITFDRWSAHPSVSDSNTRASLLFAASDSNKNETKSVIFFFPSEAVFRQAYAWSEPNLRYTAKFVEHSLIVVNRTKDLVRVLFDLSILAVSFWK